MQKRMPGNICHKTWHNLCSKDVVFFLAEFLILVRRRNLDLILWMYNVKLSVTVPRLLLCTKPRECLAISPRSHLTQMFTCNQTWPCSEAIYFAVILVSCQQCSIALHFWDFFWSKRRRRCEFINHHHHHSRFVPGPQVHSRDSASCAATAAAAATAKLSCARAHYSMHKLCHALASDSPSTYVVQTQA